MLQWCLMEGRKEGSLFQGNPSGILGCSVSRQLSFQPDSVNGDVCFVFTDVSLIQTPSQNCYQLEK